MDNNFYEYFNKLIPIKKYLIAIAMRLIYKISSIVVIFTVFTTDPNKLSPYCDLFSISLLTNAFISASDTSCLTSLIVTKDLHHLHFQV